MNARYRFAPLLAAILACCAIVAHSFTPTELLHRAVELSADYVDVIDRAEEAEPAEHAGLIAEAAGLEAERAQLVADRATLGSCSCSTLDAVIAALAVKSGELGVIIDSWNEY